MSGLWRCGRAGTGLGKARVTPRPRQGPGWRVVALGRRECGRPREGLGALGLERGPRSRARDSGVLASLGEPRIPSGRARNLVPAWPQVRGPVSPQRSRSAPSDRSRRRGNQGGLRLVQPVGPGGTRGRWHAVPLAPPRSYGRVGHLLRVGQAFGLCSFGLAFAHLVQWFCGSPHTPGGLGSISSEMLKGQLLNGFLRDGELLTAPAESLILAVTHPLSHLHFLFVACGICYFSKRNI